MKISDYIFWIAAFATFVFCCLVASGCKTCAPVTDIQYRDSVRVVERVDSVLVREKDSVFIYASNDTIYRERISIRYRDKILQQTDTCYLNHEVKVVEEVQVVPSYYRRVNVIFWVLVVIALLYIAVRVYLRFRRI